MKWTFFLRFFPSLTSRQDKRPTQGRRTVTLRLEPLEDRLTPAVLTVGPGQMYALPSQAAAAAHDGDTIDISSNGNYNGDTCRWTQNNLTIQGVGDGRAHIDITGQAAFGRKGIWVIDGSNTTVNNIELSGAHDTAGLDKNWAGIRLEGNSLTLNNDYFHNNDDGVLTGATNTSLGSTSNIAIYGCEFANNGWGDGFSHNMYIGQVTSFTLENSYSHDANVGHLVKSRALTNYILYNRLEDGSASTSTASYELDLPQGGTSYVIGNLIEQGPNSDNSTIIAYSEEGTKNPSQSLYLINNTIVNDRSGGTFVNLAYSGSSATIENNIFCGPGTVVAGSGSATQITNLVSNSPGFVNQAGYDYHLTTGSPAINAGTAPGTVNGFDLTPTSQYVDPLSLQPRPVDGALDIGAYEAPPAAPTGLTPTAGPAQVALSWTPSSGAASYNIYRGTSSGGETKVASVSTGTAYTDTGLTAGTTYYYEVTAVNSSGESDFSTEVSATTPSAPSAPTNLTASASTGQVALSWTASSGAATYNIYRSTSSGGETEVASGVMMTSFTDTGLSAGTTYYYEVTAVNSVGESGFSTEASATTPSVPPAPTGLTATAGPAQVALSWTPASGAASYNIYRGTSSGGETKVASVSTGTAYTDTGLTAGTTYYYEVTAVNSVGESGFSNEASDTTPSAPLAPTNLTASASTGQVALSWTASSGAASYNIYRSTTSGGETEVASVSTGTAYTDTGLTAGTKYFYEVTAVNSVGESGFSNEASAVPTATNHPVNLSGSFNREGIVTNGTTFSGGGLDGKGHALSSNLLGASVSWNGQTFNLGAANINNVVRAAGQTIPLPSGNYSTLTFLATGVNGKQRNQKFTVTYTDGTTQTFTQSVSDWLAPQGYGGESKAATMAYYDRSNGGRINQTTYVYGYSFALNSGKTVQRITLPNNANLEILAMDLV